ncbi:hypothetical protein [Streptomyces sp. NPDC055085]
MNQNSTLGDIRKAVRDTLSQHGLNCYDTMEDVVVGSPAALVAEPHLGDFEGAFGLNSDSYEFNLFVLVARKNTREAQHILDEYLTGVGPKSIREFISRNKTLGLPDVNARVQGLVKNTYNGNFKASTTVFVGAVLRLCVTIV